MADARTADMETEANRFAMALLMPMTLLRKETRHMRGRPLRTEDVETLARRFRVTNQTMLLRLLSVGADLGVEIDVGG